MMKRISFTEDSLIVQPAIALFAELGWDTADCYDETYGAQGTLGRETPNEVLLLSRLAPALERLNPNLPREASQLAIEELMGHYFGCLLWKDVCKAVDIPYDILPDTVLDLLSEGADHVKSIY